MGMMTATFIVGVECDVRGCDATQAASTDCPSFSPEARKFTAALLRWGWAQRLGRSIRWYCPAHAERAGHCVKGRWGRCSPWCPVHGHGQVITWDSEDVKRLAGRRNVLSDADADR